MVRSSRRAFFYCRPRRFAKAADCFIIALSSQSRGLLRAEAHLPKQPVNMRDVVAHAELVFDEARDS
jgi:hypothetical protein